MRASPRHGGGSGWVNAGHQGESDAARARRHGEAVGEAQGVQHVFQHTLVRRHHGFLGEFAARAHSLYVTSRQARLHASTDVARGIRALAVRACANADVIAERPVIQVVTRRAPGARVSRDLVAPITGRGQARDAVILLGGTDVMGRQGRRTPRERRALFQGQLVPGQVRGRQGDGLVEIAQRGARTGRRQAEHQVEIEVVETGPPRRVDRCVGLARVVHATERAQAGVVETLDPEREAIDPGRAVGAEARGVGAAGIRFEGDLDTGRQSHARGDAGQQAGDGRAAEQARCTAADEDAGERGDGRVREFLFEVGQQLVDVVRLRQLGRREVRVEIAVRAFPRAPGQVNVEAAGQGTHAGANSWCSSAASARAAWPR